MDFCQWRFYFLYNFWWSSRKQHF